MHSRGDSPRTRSAIEWVLRGLSLTMLLVLLWQSVHLLRVRPDAWARGTEIRDALVRWSTRESPRRAHVVFDAVPPAEIRDWVAALPGVGTGTTWEGPSLDGTAISVEPVADPRGTSRVWLAAPSGSMITVRDGLGTIDSVRTRGAGGVMTAPGLTGVIEAATGATTASAVREDSLTIRRVLVLSTASWEGKFVVAALEEHGWLVDARFDLRPTANGTVIQGPARLQIDTSRYAAAIVLDSSASRHASRISEFVRQGGGLIAAGDAGALPTFRSLMPGVPRGQLPPGAFETDTAHPRVALALTPVDQLGVEGVAVEMRRAGGEDRIAVAARRIGAGRVLQVGYRDTWRWRMGGADADPVSAHRHWWSAMVSSVAYAPRTRLASSAMTDATPLASLVSSLGDAQPIERPGLDPLTDPRLTPVLFGLLMSALFAEWASRRLRGRP